MPPAGSMTVQNYCNLLTRSRLLLPDEVRDIHRRWNDTKKPTDDEMESFRKFLVARKLLTEYQSYLLLRGHSEGFFLNEYKILDKIGKGSMAGVYKAAHTSGQIVSIKVLPPSKAKDPTVLSRFQREGKMLTKLEHPNVVRAFQVGEANGKHYFVMEYIEGEPLDEILERRKRLPAPEAVRLIYQTLLGLQHVFEKGLVHRDLKPSNIILVPAPTQGPNETTAGCVVRILDIGLGRSTFDENAKEPEEQLTTVGTLLGTPDYLAPEQARSAHEVDIRSDIYSLGCVLYHLLTGQSPFQDATVLGQIVKHATETARPVSEFLPNFPDGLQQVLNWMMAKDPNQRYPTPMQAAHALQAFLTQTPDSAEKNNPLPDYVKYLEESNPDIHMPAAASSGPSPGAIPVGRLETDSKRRDRKNDGTGLKSKLPAQAVPTAPIDDGEYDVEIVAMAPASGMSPGQPFVMPLTPQQTGARTKRGLFELDRRDFIMAGIGGGLVLSAILCGYGLSRLLRKPPPSPTVEEEKPAETTPQRRPPIEKKEPEKIQDESDEDKKTGDMMPEKKDAKTGNSKEEKKSGDKGEKKNDAMDAKKDDKKTESPDPKKAAKDEKKSDAMDAKKDDKKKDDKKADGTD